MNFARKSTAPGARSGFEKPKPGRLRKWWPTAGHNTHSSSHSASRQRLLRPAFSIAFTCPGGGASRDSSSKMVPTSVSGNRREPLIASRETFHGILVEGALLGEPHPRLHGLLFWRPVSLLKGKLPPPPFVSWRLDANASPFWGLNSHQVLQHGSSLSTKLESKNAEEKQGLLHSNLPSTDLWPCGDSSENSGFVKVDIGRNPLRSCMLLMGTNR